MIYLDGLEQGERKEFELKAAFASTGRFDPRAMWPNSFPSEDVEEVEGDLPDDEEAAIDFSNVKWELPEDGNAQALADLAALRGLVGRNAVSVTDGPDETGLPAHVLPTDEEWV